MKIIINGKFLCQKITGVQRFAIEIVKELDKLFTSEYEVYIVCPDKSEVCNHIDFKNIKLLYTKGKANYLWEQWTLPRFVKKQKPDHFLNLCNVAPILYPGSCVVHDLGCIDAAAGFSKKQNLVYRFINKRNIKRYKNIFTVSNVMKQRIEEYYKVSNVNVIYNSADHIRSVTAKKPNLELKNHFYFSLGSMNPNKNFKAIIRLANLNPDKFFYISGKKAKSFNDEELVIPSNVIFCGYLSDEEIVYMYRNCDAFLFPSVYEGFGIPPLEALESGCQLVICNDIPVLREVYSNYCVFVDFNTLESLDINKNIKSFESVYHWKDGAKKIFDILNAQ